MNKRDAAKLYKKAMTEKLNAYVKKRNLAAAQAINEMMLKSADDYELIYQKCVRKFYSIRAPKRYIRHGFSSPGIKRGQNLYRASISRMNNSTFLGYSIISEVETDRTLYESNTSYDTSSMLSYTSLAKKTKGQRVDPYVIVSNMMNGMRWNPAIGFRGKSTWSVGALSVKTSIGTISGGETPIDMLDIYDKIWDQNFMTNFMNYYKMFYQKGGNK